MNIDKRLAEASYHRLEVNHQKQLFKSKLEAMRPQNWDLSKVAKSVDLIEAGRGVIPKELKYLYEEEPPENDDYDVHRLFAYQNPSNQSLFGIGVIKDTIALKTLPVRSTLAYQQRRRIWAKVFDFLPEKDAPLLAGEEHVDFRDSDLESPLIGIATFTYPSFLGGDYATYSSYIDVIRERMGISSVHIEPVGRHTKDGKEITGTIGKLAFRIWWTPSPLSKDYLDKNYDFWGLNTVGAFTAILNIKTNLIPKIHCIPGFGYATSNTIEVRDIEHCIGSFRVINIISESNTAQDYMDKVDEIRKVLKAPGLMIAPFGMLNKDKRIENGISVGPDENGVHHTAFVFYVGDELKVVMDDVDLNDDGTPLAAISGFMPVHSVNHLLSPWVANPLEVIAVTG